MRRTWWMIGYGTLLLAVVVAMSEARDWALQQLATPKSLADWQAWRDDIQQQQGRRGPVERRVPKSDEPPALVLMRDHFGVSLAAAVVFSSMLYWVLAWFVTGVMKSAELPQSGEVLCSHAERGNKRK